jgi:YVTN family beta-propeller protein
MLKERMRLGGMTILLVVILTLSLTTSTTSKSRNNSSLSHSSKALALTSDGSTLIAVNPDSNSITLIETATHSVLSEIPVGDDPRSVSVDDEKAMAYTANFGSDSISVIDLTSGEKTAEIIVGNRPYGVLVDPTRNHLYVTEQGMDHLHILNTNTFGTIATLDLGDRPSGLALSNDGSKLYVTHLLNNKISVVNLDPQKIFLPFVADTYNYNSATSRFSPSPLISFPEFITSEISLWPDSNLVQSIFLSPDGDHAYIPHTRSNSSNKALTFDTTVFPLVSIIDTSRSEHMIGQQFDLGTLDPPGVGIPFDISVTPDGKEMWVLNAASNDVTVINLELRELAAHIEVGANPRGILISPDGTEVYVNNSLDGSISMIDSATYSVIKDISTTSIPLPPLLLQGKKLFHSSDDPRLSNAQWISCNTCHFEGEHDGRTWFFGFSGPRNTTSLLGMLQTYPLRWSGEWDESADSEFANIKENFGSGLLTAELNCSLSPPDCVNHPPNQGRNSDLDALAAFIDSLQIPLSPNHVNGEPLSDQEKNGQQIFNRPELGCVSCHPPPLYTDQKMHDVGTTTPDERIGPAYDTPSLRGLYGSAPYFHDGSTSTLKAALTRPSPGNEHDVSGLLTESEIEDLIAFLFALPYQ